MRPRRVAFFQTDAVNINKKGSQWYHFFSFRNLPNLFFIALSLTFLLQNNSLRKFRKYFHEIFIQSKFKEYLGIITVESYFSRESLKFKYIGIHCEYVFEVTWENISFMYTKMPLTISKVKMLLERAIWTKWGYVEARWKGLGIYN